VCVGVGGWVGGHRGARRNGADGQREVRHRAGGGTARDSCPPAHTCGLSATPSSCISLRLPRASRTSRAPLLPGAPSSAEESGVGGSTPSPVHLPLQSDARCTLGLPVLHAEPSGARTLAARPTSTAGSTPSMRGSGTDSQHLRPRPGSASELVMGASQPTLREVGLLGLWSTEHGCRSAACTQAAWRFGTRLTASRQCGKRCITAECKLAAAATAAAGKPHLCRQQRDRVCASAAPTPQLRAAATQLRQLDGGGRRERAVWLRQQLLAALQVQRGVAQQRTGQRVLRPVFCAGSKVEHLIQGPLQGQEGVGWIRANCNGATAQASVWETLQLQGLARAPRVAGLCADANSSCMWLHEKQCPTLTRTTSVMGRLPRIHIQPPTTPIRVPPFPLPHHSASPTPHRN
jgi:hypothetical protein